VPYLAQRGQSTDACDDALANCGRPGETVLREEASYYRIGADQFKSPALRALEHLVSIPSRYNAAAPTFLTRNCVAVRTTARRWRCMFYAIRELTLELHARSNAHQKAANLQNAVQHQPGLCRRRISRRT
jgi:hypothetical protein